MCMQPGDIDEARRLLEQCTLVQRET
jgi:hypothetical protein